MHDGIDSALDKKYVHKKLPENVLIKGLRRGIPAFIDRSQVENLIIPSLSLADRALFLEYYLFHDPERKQIQPDDVSDPDIENKECYVLFNIPHTIDAEYFEGEVKLSRHDRDILLRYYRKNEKTGNYILKKRLSEIEEKAIQHILGKKDIHISDNEKIILYEMFEKIDGMEKDDIFYAELLVNRRHSFFFEHQQEHVPGIMIMEASRQYAVACFHIFGKTPFKGYQFTLNSFNAKFFDYIDLHYPAGIKLEVIKKVLGRNGEWTSATHQITFFQKGNICASVEIEGGIISKKLFSRFREGRNNTSPEHRFYPVDPEICPTSLWSSDKENYHVGKLIDVSVNGFCVEIGETFEQKESKKDYDFIMYFPGIGFIRGGCQQKWSRCENDNFYGGFHITLILKADKDNLREAVKRFCHLKTDRKRL